MNSRRQIQDIGLEVEWPLYSTTALHTAPRTISLTDVTGIVPVLMTWIVCELRRIMQAVDRETLRETRQAIKTLRSRPAGDPQLIRTECHGEAFFGVLFGQNLVDLGVGVLGSDHFRLYPGYCLGVLDAVEAAASAGAEPDEGSAAAQAGPWYQEYAAESSAVSEGVPAPAPAALVSRCSLLRAHGRVHVLSQ